jgi:hypothetical protein
MYLRMREPRALFPWRRKKKEEAKNGNESPAEPAPKTKVNGIFRGVFEMTEES